MFQIYILILTYTNNILKWLFYWNLRKNSSDDFNICFQGYFVK